MAVQAIASIEHRDPLTGTVELGRQALGHPGAAMAHHQHIGAHGHVGAGRIEQALALAQGAGGGRKTLHIGREPLGRQLKTAASAGAWFKEKAGHQPPLQGGQLASSSHRQGPETLGQGQHGGEIIQRKGRQIQHVAVAPAAQGVRRLTRPP